MSDSPEDPTRTGAGGSSGPTPPVARPRVAAEPGRSARGPRRAVRRAGTVGTDESVLRSTHPAAPAAPAAPWRERAEGMTPAQVTGTSHDPAVPLRARDDTDLGWGHEPDSNDDRLHRDRPPHW